MPQEQAGPTRQPSVRKDNVEHYRVTEKKWIFGQASEMSDTPEQGYVVAKKSTKWPHYIHDYFISGPTIKIFSYANKEEAVVVEDSSDDDNVPSAHAAAPAGRLSQKRNAEGELSFYSLFNCITATFTATLQ